MSKPDAEPVPESDVRTFAQLSMDEVEKRFDAWFVETFHNVPGLTTEWFNRFRTAADASRRS
jgi:hypothetical protein